MKSEIGSKFILASLSGSRCTFKGQPGDDLSQ